jgi:hypothetical protein
MRVNDKLLKVFLILLGISAFILKSQYQGPYQELVINYGSNFLISFVIYFLLSFFAASNKFIVVVISLALVELFEVTNGYGIIPHAYDAFVLLANFIGVFLAVCLDLLIKKLSA